jgi:ABC-type branched-subunit amino acid transport system substrate-binding protein
MKSRCHLAACLLLVLGAAGCGPNKSPEPVWLGHLAPLTGTNRAQGEEAVQAMQHVLEIARERDWQVAGRNLGVRHVDASGGRSRAEAVRLLAVNRVAGLVLGPGLTDADEVAAAARTLEAAVVLLDEVADVPAGPGVIPLGPDPACRGRALAQLARTQWKKPRVAVLLDGGDRVSATVAGSFEPAWRQVGGSLREYSVADKTDLSAVKTDLAKFQPEIVLAALPTSRLRELAGVLSAVPVLYGGPDVDEEELLRHATALPAGCILHSATAFTSAATLAESSGQWRQRFEKSERKPPGRSAILACDGLQLMMSALERVKPKGSTSLRTLLRDQLGQIEELDSVTGKVVWKDGQAIRPLFLVRFVAGKPTVLATVTGDAS